MATTTPNYGWAVPTSTDLVKDGATAIETLGDALDASLVDLRGGTTGQVLKKASATQMDFEWGSAGGLTLINTTSFSAVATQSINDVFSATYDNYVVFLNMNTSSTSDLQFRWRVSGADNTTAVYNYQIAGLTESNTASNLTGAAQTLNKFSGGFTSTNTASQLNFYRPFASDRSFFTSNSIGVNSGGLGTTFTGAGQFTSTTSFTGFTIYAASGNITGTVRVYGVTN